MNNENDVSTNKKTSTIINIGNFGTRISTLLTALFAIIALVFMFLFFTANRDNIARPQIIRGSTYFHDAVATQLTEASRLVTLDIELEQTVVPNNDARWGIFRASQEITFYATETFSTNLASLTGDDIIIDDRRERVIVRLPHPQIEAITIDPDRTVFQDPARGLLQFRDVTKAPQEQNTIQSDVINDMMLVMKSYMDYAYHYTKSAVSNLLGIILESMSVGDYEFEITWQ